ncbi:hypothetical protein M0L20_04730 [Spirosoma sp. RP8]|uniref:Uncharacterized protein n=1 Tax=Spirosoma liriopis TaxID=2937440 RepID=A0ABT0HG81_9BACT|nr:hypothetical protein [Spirosoma liriopis]
MFTRFVKPLHSYPQPVSLTPSDDRIIAIQSVQLPVHAAGHWFRVAFHANFGNSAALTAR